MATTNMAQNGDSKILSGLTAIVIGAGLAGLAASIELARLGANVKIFESSRDLKKQGDVIRFEANASRAMEPWGDVLETVVRSSSPLDKLIISNKDGRMLLEQPLQTEFDGYPNTYAKRGHIHQTLLDYATKLGVDVILASPVTAVFESDTRAGVHVRGETFVADCVLAGDGVRSQARAFVTGTVERPKKSGYAIYRTWFPLDVLHGDSVVEHIATSKAGICKVWIGQDAHAVLTTNVAMRAATCFFTHKDLSDIDEDWNTPGSVEDMLACADGWDPVLQHIIKRIPGDSLVDHKMLWRDPVQKWVSPKGRICLIGDAAHPHLPTSGTGAAQAFEGATTIGALLQKSIQVYGGPVDTRLAFEAYEKLRYERTSLTQRMGWETRHVWHQTDWDAVAADPNYLKMPQPDWLLGHDARKYARENFEGVVAHLRGGKPFTSTNVPKGHVHEEWTVEALLAREGGIVDQSFYVARE